jgi:hypothetical protein
MWVYLVQQTTVIRVSVDTMTKQSRTNYGFSNGVRVPFNYKFIDHAGDI